MSQIPGSKRPLFHFGNAILLVTAEMDPAHEDDINRWYDEEHFPERLQCPGFVWGRRYRSVEGGSSYLSLYGLEDIDVLSSDAYLRIRPTTERQERVVIGHLRTSRAVYRDITPELPAGYRVNAVRKPQSA